MAAILVLQVPNSCVQSTDGPDFDWDSSTEEGFLLPPTPFLAAKTAQGPRSFMHGWEATGLCRLLIVQMMSTFKVRGLFWLLKTVEGEGRRCSSLCATTLIRIGPISPCYTQAARGIADAVWLQVFMGDS